MKKLFGITTGILSPFALALPAYAATPVSACPPGGTGLFDKLCFSAKDLGPLVGQVLNFVFLIGALAALAYLIYGGIKWITSEGDKTNVEAARNQIIASIIGLIVIAVSFLVINLVLQFFGGGSLTNLIIPQVPPATNP